MTPETAAGLEPGARAAFEKLADVAVPAPVSWAPATWGWAALAVVLLALAAWGIVRWRERRAANQYRAEALTELARLEADLADAERRATAMAAMPPLLKRVALAAWPRPAVAPLSGAAWVRFLRAHAGRGSVPETIVRLLDDGEYRAAAATVTPEEARAVTRAVRAWIEGHRVSA